MPNPHKVGHIGVVVFVVCLVFGAGYYAGSKAGETNRSRTSERITSAQRSNTEIAEQQQQVRDKQQQLDSTSKSLADNLEEADTRTGSVAEGLERNKEFISANRGDADEAEYRIDRIIRELTARSEEDGSTTNIQ